MLHPWLDALSDTLLLIYVDARGQGRSQPVDPATLTLDVFANDINQIAQQLGLRHFGLYGHSYGAMITLTHAMRYGSAAQYILSSGTASSSKSTEDILKNIEAFEPESTKNALLSSHTFIQDIQTQEDVRRLRQIEWPFHFYRADCEACEQFIAQDHTIYSIDVLKYFDENESTIECEDQLYRVKKPTLIITGEYDRICTVRASQALHKGIINSKLVIIPDAGHLAYVEQPSFYLDALRSFLQPGLA
jgi:proline-specific peptidase